MENIKEPESIRGQQGPSVSIRHQGGGGGVVLVRTAVPQNDRRNLGQGIATVAPDVELVSERKKTTPTTETPDPEDLKPWGCGGG